MIDKKNLKKISPYLWEIPQKTRSDMRVPARVYASQELLEEILRDRSLEQLINVATLPGIVQYALAMPDAHEGYGFPIGGVGAFDLKEGVISPGGIGYDINCGTRLLKTPLFKKDLQPRLEQLAQAIYQAVPSGVGVGGRIKLEGVKLDQILEKGAQEVVNWGFGQKEDLVKMESQGRLKEASADFVSPQAKARGRSQLGTLGAGNHFVEIEVVEKIFNAKTAQELGLAQDQVMILIHTGSRGLGHQIATDYIRVMIQALSKYNIQIPDRELACAPFESSEGQNYFQAMACGANFAWANRQMITHEIRDAWEKTFAKSADNLETIYDVAHNIAKVEEFEINGQKRKLLVHRKGATRSFPGQPVIIPGSMGTGSYLLLGQEESLRSSFGSTCHGAGRRMSRTQAIKTIRVTELKERLQKKGIIIQAGSMKGLAEEAPEAYKDVDKVVEVIAQAGIAKKVVRLKPMAVVKG